MSPNYEILFFSSEISEVVNILDFFEKKDINLKEEVEKFKADGESKVAETHWNLLL